MTKQHFSIGSNDTSEEAIVKTCQTAEMLTDILNRLLKFPIELTDDSTLSIGQKQNLALC